MDAMQQRALFPVESASYNNPFHAMLNHGIEWAWEDLPEEAMMARAEKLGGPVLTEAAKTNLLGFAQELRQQQRTEGEK